MEELESFPPEILRNPQPFIAFHGLDVTKDIHKKIWEVFTHTRGNDRYSLYFSNFTELAFPQPKQSKSSYEWYVAKGVLKKGWIQKYQNVIPSVLVLFGELDWTDPNINKRTEEFASQIQLIKEALKGRGTKIAVILIQNDKSLGDSESVTNFCTECEISPRSLFVIGLQDSLLPTVMRLETSLHELSQNFYHLEIKNVRSHNEALNKSTHLLLMVRHMFKIGYFNEMKSDLHSAQKAYQTSYALLLEAKLTDFNLSEYRTVAGYISYKICRLAFKLNLTRDAVAQFRRHIDNFKARTGVPELGWEHAAWQAQQAEMFANLFLAMSNATNGQLSVAAVHGQHPGVHYQLAAEYAISRRKLAEAKCSQIQSYPSQDPLLQDTMFYGQRAWRAGKIEAVDLQREKEGIEALQYRERTKTKHCQIITRLQEAAIEQFKNFNSMRMMNNVQVQMADELLIDQKHSKALKYLLESSEIYHQEGWNTLATACLLKAIKCAFLVVNTEQYLNLCLALMSQESECNEAEKTRIEQNFYLVLEGKPPLPEPSLTCKSERALVGQATKLWKDKLESSDETITVQVPKSSALDLCPVMPKDARLGENINITLQMVNCTSRTLNTNCDIAFNLVAYNTQAKIENLKLEPASKEVYDHVLCMQNSDAAGQKLTINEINISLEMAPKLVFVKSVDGVASNIVPRDSQLDIKMAARAPALVGEWFDLELEISSRENDVATNIEVLCWLRDGGDPLIADTTCLSTFPGFPTTPSTPGGSQPLQLIKSSVTLHSLAPGESSKLTFYLNASTIGNRVLSCQLRYTGHVNNVATMSSCATLFNIDVIQPFTFSFLLHNKMLAESKVVHVDENFCITPKIECASPHELVVTESRLETKLPVTLYPPTHSLVGSEISRACVISQLFPATVHKSNIISISDTDTVNLGKFYLKWKRKSSTIENEVSFVIESVTLVNGQLDLSCELPGYAVLRKPITVTYGLENKTDVLQEYAVTMEPSDSFMFSGPKQLKLKIFPRDKTFIKYLLHPLLSGNLSLPKIRIVPLTRAGVPSMDKIGMLEDLLSRSVPTHIFVLPQHRAVDSQQSADQVDDSQERGSCYELKETVVVQNLGFTKQTVKTNA